VFWMAGLMVSAIDAPSPRYSSARVALRCVGLGCSASLASASAAQLLPAAAAAAFAHYVTIGV
jgi:hypothetical protein